MDKREQKTEMNICSTNKSDRLSLVMGPSTVPCMMATSPLTSSAPYSAGVGQLNHKPAYRVSVASLEATGRLSMTLASNKQQNKTEGGKHREKRRGEKQNRHNVKTKQDCSPYIFESQGTNRPRNQAKFFQSFRQGSKGAPVLLTPVLTSLLST
jgi:hypothetical protein